MAALLLIAGLLGFLHWRGESVCLFHRLTGLPCLTCGSTRAACALLSGDWRGALRVQPLAVVFGGLASVVFGAYSVCLLFLGRVPTLRMTPGERCAGVGILVALAVLNWFYLVWRGV